jgi:hypothetical protein
MVRGNALHAALATLEPCAWFAAHLASGFSGNAVGWEWVRDHEGCPPGLNLAANQGETRQQVPLFHDIFGNPFRPTAMDPGWLSWNGGTIPTLARAVYEERELPSGHLDRVRLALLADMLEDAGCIDANILEHLRGPGPHIRGCWVMDLLLGKQ